MEVFGGVGRPAAIRVKQLEKTATAIRKISGDRTKYSIHRTTSFGQHHLVAIVIAAVMTDAEAIHDGITALKAYAAKLVPPPPTVEAAPQEWPQPSGMAGSSPARATHDPPPVGLARASYSRGL